MKSIATSWVIALLLPFVSFAQTTGERNVHPGIIQTNENHFGHLDLNSNSTCTSNEKSETTIFYEGFEEPTANGALPPGWEIKRTSSLGQTPVTSAAAPHWFRNSLDFNGFSNPAPYIFQGQGSMAIGYNAPEFTWAITPTISIPNNSGNINLSYWVWYLNDFYQGTMYYSNYHVMILADGQWQNLISFIGNNDNSNLFSSPVLISLNAFKGKDVRLAFVYQDTYGWQMAIDEIIVREETSVDFGLKNLNVSPLFGLLPGDEVFITATAYLNSQNTGSTNVSLMINGQEVDMITTSELTFAGMEQRVRFSWHPEVFGEYVVEVRLANDEILANNSLSQTIYVNHQHKLAEDFEKVVLDGLGFPYPVFPPPGWVISNSNWVQRTADWKIFENFSAIMIGRENVSENYMITTPVTFSSEDKWLRFFIRGLNNNINISQSQYPNASPFGIQGFSTIQLRIAPTPDGPWFDIGAPVEFKNVYDENNNLIQSANGMRMVEIDVSLLSGTFYLGFFHTSSFELTIGGAPMYSYVVIDNVMVSNTPPELKVRVLDQAGNGISNAVVQITNPEGQVLRRLKTQSNGLVSTKLLEGNYTVLAERLGYSSFQGSVSVSQPLQEMDITLQQAPQLYSVSFEVVYPDQFPAPNAQISISSFTGNTGSDGKVTIENLAPGTYNFSVFLSGFITYNGTVQVVDNNVTRKITLQPVGTSVTDLVNAPNISVYPNPAINIVNIVSDVQIIALQVIDLSGRVVLDKNVNAQTSELNVSALKNGLYILNVTTTQGRKTAKLQVMK